MRLKLAYTLGNRSATTDKDERVLNGYVEGEKKDTMVFKRPGMVSSYSVTAGRGQGLIAFVTPSAPGVSGSVTLVAIAGDKLTSPV